MNLTEVSRGYFDRAARTQEPATAADMRALAASGSPDAAARLSREPYYNSVMRTTCVATRLFAGHADNALPQLARATVNCRLVPSESPDSVQEVLGRVVADTAIHITRAGEAWERATAPSPLRPDLMTAVEDLVSAIWGAGVAVVPEMSTGATDGLFTRQAGIPTYGVGGLFEEAGDARAHGRDERVGVTAYHQAAEFWYRLVKRLSSTAPGA